MSRRCNYKPEFKFSIWKPDGKFWYVDRADMEAAIRRSCRDEDDLLKRLGAGYHYLEDLLNGKRLDKWSILHVEWGITPESEITYAPPCGTLVSEL